MKTKIMSIILVLVCSLSLAGWESVTSPVDSHLRAISYVDADNVFIAGSDGTICQYDGSTWTSISPVTEKGLNAICMLTADSGWAVGAEGTVLRYENDSWTALPVEDEDHTYNDVLGFAEDDVYFIGYSLLGGTTLQHWNGTELTEMQTFSDNLSDLDGTGPDDIWVAGGNGYVAHYDGSSWDTSYASFSEPTKIFGMTLNEVGYPVLTAVEGSGWDRDVVVEYVPGTGWVQLFQNWEKRIMCCDIKEKRGFAMGSGGRVVEYSIFGWQEITALGKSQINDIHMADMANGWAVADSGNIYRYTESAINVQLENADVGSGDTFDLSIELLNPGDAQNGVMEIVMLEAYGSFFFWPAWGVDFDSSTITLTADMQETTAIFTFPWPDGAGAGEAAFWGALLNNQGEILGYDIESFMWH